MKLCLHTFIEIAIDEFIAWYIFEKKTGEYKERIIF